jgi:hypothetical protein
LSPTAEWHVVLRKPLARSDIGEKASLALDGSYRQFHHRQGGLKDALF